MQSLSDQNQSNVQSDNTVANLNPSQLANMQMTIQHSFLSSSSSFQTELANIVIKIGV
jgi:hypothetical protein